MRTARIVEVLSDSKPFARHHAVRLPKARDVYTLGDRRGRGGFGELWTARPDRPKGGEPAVVVKKVNEKHTLVDCVADLQRALERMPALEWADRLLAFPFSIALAEIEGEEAEAIFMLDLAELGYEPATPQFEQGSWYGARPVHERVELAHGYARTAELFEQIRLIHADQNHHNLMFNLSTLDTQVVDLDAGAISETGAERPLTLGHEDNLVPPEVRVPGAGPVGVDSSKWDLDAERWSVGILVGQLVFGFDPSFFLRSSARAYDAYAREGPWPQIELDSTQLEEGAEVDYEECLPYLEAAPGGLVETFGRFFKAGARGAERPSARDWIEALDVAREKPIWISLTVTPTVVPEGSEVTIAWEAGNADHVEHPTLGKLPAEGEATVVVVRTGRQTFTAANYYGRVERATEVVRVVPLPQLRTIPVADFPELELKPRIAPAAARRPAPVVPPRLSRAVGVPPPAPVAVRAPRPLPAPPRFGDLFRPIPVSRRIRTMMRKEPTK